jgi:hypothetical protein
VGPAVFPASRLSSRLIFCGREKPVRKPARRQDWRPHLAQSNFQKLVDHFLILLRPVSYGLYQGFQRSALLRRFTLSLKLV